MEDKDNNWKAMLAVALVSVVAAVGITLAVTSDDDDDDDEPDTIQTASVPDPAASAAPTQDDIDVDANDTVVDTDDTGDPVVDADDQPISNADADRASKAALAAADGGTVTDLDRSDDPGEAWEVEVTMDDGSELDVALDEKFNRVENTSYDD